MRRQPPGSWGLILIKVEKRTLRIELKWYMIMHWEFIVKAPNIGFKHVAAEKNFPVESMKLISYFCPFKIENNRKLLPGGDLW